MVHVIYSGYANVIAVIHVLLGAHICVMGVQNHVDVYEVYIYAVKGWLI